MFTRALTSFALAAVALGFAFSAPAGAEGQEISNSEARMILHGLDLQTRLQPYVQIKGSGDAYDARGVDQRADNGIDYELDRTSHIIRWDNMFGREPKVTHEVTFFMPGEERHENSKCWWSEESTSYKTQRDFFDWNFTWDHYGKDWKMTKAVRLTHGLVVHSVLHLQGFHYKNVDVIEFGGPAGSPVRSHGELRAYTNHSFKRLTTKSVGDFTVSYEPRPVTLPTGTPQCPDDDNF